MAALFAAGATAAPHLPADIGAAEADQGYITREWTWATGTAITTFTAHGPADQVNALDPQGDPLQCQGCELASSIQFEPGDEVEPAASR